ncbi:C40 family peptidase [Solilutibacter tolerans]|uniref:Cell wall-associated hydrolase, NlpC family n=1 Tax=Solilutibacter tolerans TaxID=1604334 RepID=A0A1N6PBD4_9GAMM|nr:C40 family peptidase [Lysobacter tolerans]SIQ01502.1 Cell wall-associated hydrolase, NlpC family [Lysobacter tolerans]
MSTHYPARTVRMPAPGRYRTIFLAACLSTTPAAWAADEAPAAPDPANVSQAVQANDVLIRAISLVGTPYVWGGNTPESGFDCSGLVNYVFRDMLNLRLPRTSRELSALSAPAVDSSGLATGDLVFFASGGQVSHVGIYVGDGRFVHAPRTGGVVRLERLDGRYWQQRYAGARRVLAGL